MTTDQDFEQSERKRECKKEREKEDKNNKELKQESLVMSE